MPSWGPPATPGKTDGIKHYQGDVQATIDFGFDGIKLDGCGEFMNLSYFADLMNATGRPILIEDCHCKRDPTRAHSNDLQIQRHQGAATAQATGATAGR